jgi:diadenosine tetraphosphatase ApaH/serine/threonine PP2A family protein phosphatase
LPQLTSAGQFFDLLEIFRRNGYPSETHHYLFNGDFVDRGSWSTEVALLLYAYKWLYPTSFYLNRGNHETDDMNKMYGFEGECVAKYNKRTYSLFAESFALLPLATLIGGKFLVLHGGLFSSDDVSLDDIRKVNRKKQRQPGQSGLMMEMLWTDPQTEPGRGPSKRGVGMQFGPDVTKRFCEKNGLEAIIRSHEVRMEGYEVEHGGRCITGGSGQRLIRAMLTDSVLCPALLRQHREQGRLHRHRPRLQAQVHQVRGRSAPQRPRNGEFFCWLLAPLTFLEIRGQRHDADDDVNDLVILHTIGGLDSALYPVQHVHGLSIAWRGGPVLFLRSPIRLLFSFHLPSRASTGLYHTRFRSNKVVRRRCDEARLHVDLA